MEIYIEKAVMVTGYWDLILFVTKYCDAHICIYKEDLWINKQTDSKNLIIIWNKNDVE